MNPISNYAFAAPVNLVSDPGSGSGNIAGSPASSNNSGADDPAHLIHNGNSAAPIAAPTIPINWEFSRPIVVFPHPTPQPSTYSANRMSTLETRLLKLWRQLKFAPTPARPVQDTKYDGDSDESDTSMNDVGDDDFVSSDSMESEEEVGVEVGSEQENRKLSNMLLTLQGVTEQVQNLIQENKKLWSKVEDLEYKNIEFLRRCRYENCESNSSKKRAKLQQKDLSGKIGKLIQASDGIHYYF